MSRIRQFSVYLLKPGFDSSNALKNSGALRNDVEAQGIPENSELYVLDAAPKTLWWTQYLGITEDLRQMQKGAILFLNTGSGNFAITFGNVGHHLVDHSYYYDFGLRVTLNCVDPEKLKSTDYLEPGVARRQRTQLPIASNLTYFDFDQDSTIIRKLTGKVQDQHQDLIRNVTGSSNLRVGTKVDPSELTELCSKLKNLYDSEAFKETFPDLYKINPVKDPEITGTLNDALLTQLQSENSEIMLAIPDIIDYDIGFNIRFAGVGGGLIHDDLYIDLFYEYLKTHDINIKELDWETLQKCKILLTDDEGNVRRSYSLSRSLITDVKLDDHGVLYHLTEGEWYRVEESFIDKLQGEIDPFCANMDLLDFQHSDEAEYNKALSNNMTPALCLDRRDISPEPRSPVEPCDVFALEEGVGKFIHVKISTRSHELSHLFNQGANAFELLKSDDTSKEKMFELIDAEAEEGETEKFKEAVCAENGTIVYAIITHKSIDNASENLPLFSRITLARIIRYLRLIGAGVQVTFVVNKVEKKAGKKKPRKSSAVS